MLVRDDLGRGEARAGGQPGAEGSRHLGQLRVAAQASMARTSSRCSTQPAGVASGGRRSTRAGR